MSHDRIIKLLASGLKAAQVATIVGISPARLSQLTKEEDFQLKLADKVAELSTKDMEEVSLTAKYHAAEVALVTQVLEMAPMAELKDVVGALRVVAERQDKRKLTTNPVPLGGGVILNQVIQLAIPNHAIPELSLTQNREVIAIGDKQLAPMSSEGVTNLFKSLDNKGDNHVTRRLPQEPERITEQTTKEEPMQLELLMA